MKTLRDGGLEESRGFQGEQKIFRGQKPVFPETSNRGPMGKMG